MSYAIFYNSFNTDVADKKWEDFDTVLHEALTVREKIKELKKRESEASKEYDLSDEEIYSPALKDMKEEKIAAGAQAREKHEKELNILQGQSLISGADIMYYVEDQESVEADGVISLMVELDLLFGGKGTYFSSAVDPIFAIETSMRILFPELGLKENEGFKAENCVLLAKYLREFDERFNAKKEELVSNKDLDIKDENDLRRWKDDLRDYLEQLRPVLEDVAGGNAQFFCWSDSEQYPDDPLLEDRAKRHVEMLKDNPLMKIPLQNFEG